MRVNNNTHSAIVSGILLALRVCIPSINRLALPHRRRGLASDGVRYAGARSSVGRRFRSVTKLRLEWYGGVFLLLQQRSKHPREMGYNAHGVNLTISHTLSISPRISLHAVVRRRADPKDARQQHTHPAMLSGILLAVLVCIPPITETKKQSPSTGARANNTLHK